MERGEVGEICNVIGGGTPSTTNSSYWNGDIPWFTPTEIKSRYCNNSQRRITEDGLKNSSAKLLPAGTLLLTTRATIGDVCIAKQECTTNQGFQNLIAIENKSYNIYLYYWIQTQRNELRRRANGSTFLEISSSEIKKLGISLPSLPEQQKIADFLTAIDEKITILTDKITELQTYKKGMMQKLLSGEPRFPGFTDAWREVRLGEIAKKQSSNISAKELKLDTGKFAVYGANGFLGRVSFFTEKEAYISIVKDGAGIGRVLLCEPNSSVLGTLDIIQPKEKTNLFYLYYVLQKINFIKYAIGSTIPHIYFKDYSKTKLLVPNYEEQQKIADFLSAIDDKLTIEQEKLDQLKRYKQGLLQRMFV